jgi:hypothetical protein
MQVLEQVPDSVKLSTALSSSVFTFMGLPVEQWMFILSAIVSVLFIIEKIPKVILSIQSTYRWFKGDKDALS